MGNEIQHWARAVRPRHRRADAAAGDDAGLRRRRAHQGHRQYRGRPRQPAGRLRPRGRPQRHGRRAQQLALHQAEPAGHARAAGRQYPRREHADGQRRRRHGDRQPAALRHPGLPARCQRRRHRRCQEPAGRHAAGDAAARRRRRGLRHRPGRGLDQRLLGPGRRRLGGFGRADHRPHLVGCA